MPRKGFDVLIDAVAGLPDVQLAIAGAGRDRARLERRATARGLGVAGAVPRAGARRRSFPRLYGCADVFAMPCRDRWGGLEAEGFGIVFLEAAAAGVPAVAGRSGGSHEAVVDGETGFVVDAAPSTCAARSSALLADDELRAAHGRRGAGPRGRASSPTTRSRRGWRRSSRVTSPASGR